MKKLLFAILMLLAMSACSTTAKLAEGDVLYTGVKKLDVTAAACNIFRSCPERKYSNTLL